MIARNFANFALFILLQGTSARKPGLPTGHHFGSNVMHLFFFVSDTVKISFCLSLAIIFTFVSNRWTLHTLQEILA
jgi:hypothetical protein